MKLSKLILLILTLVFTLSLTLNAASLKKATAVKKKVTIGIIKGVECGDYCYLTILRKDNNKEITLMGGSDLTDDTGEINKKYKNVEVKVTWHTEKLYIPEDGAYHTTDTVDKVEILK